MLPPTHRLRASNRIRAAVRRGERAGTGLLVLHVLADPASGDDVKVALVVGRAVGGSVARHRVQRRLRHQIASRLGGFAPGSQVVIRARPECGQATSEDIGMALDRAMARMGARR